MDARLNHVAFVVTSVEAAAEKLRPFGFDIGPAETFEGEGTKEIYVQGGTPASLLLMQPTRAGSYQKALDKRGPGLHHIAIDVPSMNEAIENLKAAGWTLHPTSEKSIPGYGTAWLQRKGFPLIEMVERKKGSTKDLFISEIGFQTELNVADVAKGMGLAQILKPATRSYLRAGGHEVPFEKFLN